MRRINCRKVILIQLMSKLIRFIPISFKELFTYFNHKIKTPVEQASCLFPSIMDCFRQSWIVSVNHGLFPSIMDCFRQSWIVSVNHGLFPSIMDCFHQSWIVSINHGLFPSIMDCFRQSWIVSVNHGLFPSIMNNGLVQASGGMQNMIS